MPDGASANTAPALEKSDVSRIFLYDDGAGLYLVIIHDEPQDGSGGSVSFTFAGVPGGAGFVVGDEPGEVGLPTTNWNWLPCCTDGGVIGPLTGDWTIRITNTFTSGINSWEWLSDDINNPTRTPLNMGATLEIRSTGAPMLTNILDGAPLGCAVSTTACNTVAFSDAVEQKCADEFYSVPGEDGQQFACTFCFMSECAGFFNTSGLVAEDDLAIDGGLTVSNAIPLFDTLVDGPGASTSAVLDANRTYILFLVQNGTLNEGISGAKDVFFSTTADNSDGFDHVRSFTSALNGGATAYAWEDLTDGGDQDFTDHTIVAGDCEPINRPPNCSDAVASVDEVWPPNHKFVSVNVLGVTDPDGDPVIIRIDGISQDEPLDTFGDGSFEPDGGGVGTDTAQVRAERSGTKKVPGNGRVYHINFTADDGQGGTCSGTVTACVPHDQRPGTCNDGGPLFESTGL